MSRSSFKVLVRNAAIAIPAIGRLVDQRNALLEEVERLTEELRAANMRNGQRAAPRSSVLDAYCLNAPSRQNSFDLFKDEWSSRVPFIAAGQANLFEDHRIEWLERKCGGFHNKRILELGPLEGGHTFMMARRGAAHITSIEANSRAFLKCLIVKEALGFSAEFLLGDFCKYVTECQSCFDFILASGVLYHMTTPIELLEGMANVADSFGIWTHYFDRRIIEFNANICDKFDLEPVIRKFRGREVALHKQRYLAALNWKGFCGGSTPESYWMTKDGLLNVLAGLGFSVETHMDHQDHPNGPSILLYAAREHG